MLPQAFETEAKIELKHYIAIFIYLDIYLYDTRYTCDTSFTNITISLRRYPIMTCAASINVQTCKPIYGM